MNMYIVAYMTFFENVMVMKRVSADTAAEAMLSVLKGEGWNTEDLGKESREDKIKTFAFDCDAVIGAIQI